MAGSRLKCPNDLGPNGSAFWEMAAQENPDLMPVDSAALRMACLWIDRIERWHVSDDKSADVKMGIATDKFLSICDEFGFTPKARKKAGLEGSKKPKAVVKKTSLDTLRPGHAGMANGSAKS